MINFWKVLIIVIFSIPCFYSCPPTALNIIILPGINLFNLLYMLLMFAVILFSGGIRRFFLSIKMATIVSISVVFIGSSIAFIRTLLLPSISKSINEYSPYYIALLINMYTVVPISLTIMSFIPVAKLENSIIQAKKEINIVKKALLMFLRVVNHILYQVIPTIMQIMNEEKSDRKSMFSRDVLVQEANSESLKMLFRNVRLLLVDIWDICVATICLSIEYIPIWAIEISKLT